MKELDELKKDVRKLCRLLKQMRDSLDDGDSREYDLLDEAEPIVKSFNRSLREIGKTLDKHQEV